MAESTMTEKAKKVKDIGERLFGKTFGLRNNIGRTIKIREGPSHAKLTELANKYTNIEHDLKFALFWFADKTLNKYRRGLFKWSKTNTNEQGKNAILSEFETILEQINDVGSDARTTKEKRNLQIQKISEIFNKLYNESKGKFGEDTEDIIREGLISIDKKTIVSTRGVTYRNKRLQANLNWRNSINTRDSAVVSFAGMIILMGATLAIAIISSSGAAAIPAGLMVLLIKVWIPKNRPESYFIGNRTIRPKNNNTVRRNRTTFDPLPVNK